MSFWMTEDRWQHLDDYILIKVAVVQDTQQMRFNGARNCAKVPKIGGSAESNSSMT